jgi:hypothetical protein
MFWQIATGGLLAGAGVGVGVGVELGKHGTLRTSRVPSISVAP